VVWLFWRCLSARRRRVGDSATCTVNRVGGGSWPAGLSTPVPGYAGADPESGDVARGLHSSLGDPPRWLKLLIVVQAVAVLSAAGLIAAKAKMLVGPDEHANV
jgi:hypothetical protein